MPYWFVGVIHQMEAGGKFTTHIHNGDPLTARTVNVPKNRPVNGNPPFTWEFSAIDALFYQSIENEVWKRLKNDWSIDAILQKLEAWNGLGYKKKGVSNPYLWSYTNYYTSGKYVRDGVYDPNAISKQPGVAAIIKTLLEVTPDAITQTTGLTGSNPEQAISRGETNNSYQNSEKSSKNNLTSSGLTNIFKTVLTPGEINIPTVDTEQTKNEIATGLGYIPLLWYNAYQIDVNDIKYLSLYDDGIAPALKVSFIDSLNLMRDKAFPLDDTKITIFINSRSEQLKPIFLQFKIRNFTNTNGLLSIDAIIDVNGLFIKKFQSYNSMTSNKALQEVCKDLGLGFNTNIIDTNDEMTWINTGNKPYDFILDVVDHSYISDESFIYGYIDFYYNYNFVDIQKELSRNIEQEMGIVKLTMEEILNPVDKGLVSMLVLTNDASAIGSNIYFSSYRTINSSTSLSLEYGYRDIIKYYDILDKSFLQFNIESLNNDSDKSIILKGSPQDTEFYSKNNDYHYSGKVDHDNVHKNYNYSKIGLEVELNTPNFNIYKFQKIKVFLSNNTPTISADMINQRLSGDWIIIDIRYVYDKQMKQIVTLVRRELSLSNEELDSEPLSSTTSNSDNSRGRYTNPFTDHNINNIHPIYNITDL
jgi:lysozyme family protein